MATFKFPKKDPAENPSLAGDTQFYSTLTMLTQIYFPELIPALESIDGLKNEAIDRYAQIFQLKPRTLSEQQCRMDLIESAHQSITLHFEFRRKLFEIANRTRDGGLITWIKDSFHVN